MRNPNDVGRGTRRRARMAGGASLIAALVMCAGAGAPPNAVGDGAAPVAGDALYLRAGVVQLPARAGALADAVRTARAGERHVIQLDGPMTPARRRALEAAGVRLGAYLPSNAFVARLDGADALAAGALGFVRWTGDYAAAWKVDPEIGNRAFAPSSQWRRDLAARGEAALVVTLFGDASAAEVQGVLGFIDARPDGATLGREQMAGEEILHVRLSIGDLGALAALPAVQYVEEAPDVTYRNDTDRWIVQSDVPNVTPVYDAGIHGEGQVIGHLDGAIDQNHCSFFDTNPIGPTHRKLLAYNRSPGADSHGTHTACTAAGDAGNNTATRGVAYLAKLVHGAVPSFSETGINNALTTHHNQGARVHTNSWGDDGTTSYNTLCRGIDSFQYSHEDSLVLFAVTNTSTLKNPENAKNLLAVGASQDTPNEGNFCSGGTGPTSDGRRKPEVFAPGCGTVSAQAGTSCSVVGLTGTSMACPAVTAAGALVRQYYVDGYYPSGLANPTDGFTPSAALIKASLINSAVNMTGIAGYPSNQEGWGRILLDNALYFDGDARRSVVYDVRNASGMSTTDVVMEMINVGPAAEALEVTLVWTEPPAASGVSNATVNDLDLELVAPDNTVYKGNVFSGGASVPGGAKDAKNNVEQVILPTPQKGAWMVRIIGAAVNQGTQGYALIATGDVTTGPTPLSISARNFPTLVAPGDPASFEVTVNPGAESVVGAPMLHYRASGGAFTDSPLTPVGGDMYLAELPPAGCGDTPEYYVSAEGTVSGVRTAPSDAPASLYSHAVGTDHVVFSDDMETDMGWTVGDPADTATTGIWVRVDPVGTIAQPEDDHTPPPGTMCWVTGQGVVGGADGANDVDGGATTLFTPPLDLSTSPEARIGYWRWYSNSAGPAPGADIFVVEVYDTSSSSWVNVETLGPTGPDTMGGWIYHEFRVADLVPTTANVRLRFIASDFGSGSYIEAGIDDFQVHYIACDRSSPCPADFDGDGQVGAADLSLLLGSWGGTGVPQDLDGDGMVGSADLAILLGSWGPCPP